MPFSRHHLISLLNLRPTEELPLVWLLLHSFCAGVALVFLEMTANTLFLREFEAETLPYVYIMVALTSVSAGYIYARLQKYVKPFFLLLGVLICLLSGTLSLYVGLQWVVGDWFMTSAIALLLMVWKGVHWTMLALEFWALAGLIFNVRQGKRLFGLISSGYIVATIVGGFTVSFLMQWMGLAHLLLISAFGIVGSIFSLVFTVKYLQPHVVYSSKSGFYKDVDSLGRRSFSRLIRDVYLQLFFLISILTSFAYYLVDFVFYDVVANEYGSEAEMAAFFGVFYAVLGLVTLISNTLFSGRLLTRYGLNMGLLSLPLVVGFWVLVAIFIDMGDWGFGGFFFWMVVVSKLFDEMLRTALESPAFRILYQPLSSAEQLYVQGIREGIIEPAAIGCVGVGLLLLVGFLGWDADEVIYLLFSILVLWVLVAFLLRQQYTFVLMRALNSRKLSHLSIALEDASSLRVLQRGLESPRAGEVIYCLTMLEEMEHTSLHHFLIRLLGHAEVQVRLYVLGRIEALAIFEGQRSVDRLLMVESSAVVKGAALRALCTLAEAEAFDQVAAYLEDVHLDVRRGAMVGLLRCGGIDGVLKVGEVLNGLLESPVAEDRRFAAQVLGEVGITSFYRPLLKLLNDQDNTVRIAALAAAGKLKNPRLLPLILDNLGVSFLREHAVEALVQFGELGIPALEKYFQEGDEGKHYEVLRWVVRIYGRVRGQLAIDMLRKKLDFPVDEVQEQVIHSLIECGYRAVGGDVSHIKILIHKKVENIAWLYVCLEDVGEDSQTGLLVRALKNQIERQNQLLFALMAFLYPSEQILQAGNIIRKQSNRLKANAIEALDNLLTQDLKDLLFPLLDELSPAQRVSRLYVLFPQNRLGRVERLKAILQPHPRLVSAWVKSCALYAISKMPQVEFCAVVIMQLNDSSALVRETAVWALTQIAPDNLGELLLNAKRDRSKVVANLARLAFESVGMFKLKVRPHFMSRSGRYRHELFTHILLDEGEYVERRCYAAQILGRLGGTAAHAALIRALYVKDVSVLGAVLAVMVRYRYHIYTNEEWHLIRLLQEEVRVVKQILLSLQGISLHPQCGVMRQALVREVDIRRCYLLHILVVLTHQHEVFERLHYWLQVKKGADMPAVIREELGNICNILFYYEITEPIESLLCLHEPEQWLESWSSVLPAGGGNALNTLQQIAFGVDWGNGWTQANAIYTLVLCKARDCEMGLLGLIQHPNEVVRETAIWALHTLAPDVYRRHEIDFRYDSSFVVANLMRQLADSPLK